MGFLNSTKKMFVVALAAVGIMAAGCEGGGDTPPGDGTGTGTGTSNLPTLKDTWSNTNKTGAYDKFLAGQWASDSSTFSSSTIKKLADINTSASGTCDKTIFSDCTLPDGVTAGQIQYVLDLSNALKQLKSIIDLVAPYLGAPQRAAISSDTIMSLYPSITAILVKSNGTGLLDYIGKAYTGYMASVTPTAEPYALTFTGGTITVGSNTVNVANLPIDTAGISVLEMLNQLLRGVMDLVEMFNATPGDVNTNPTAKVLLGMLLGGDTTSNTAAAPYCMPWVTSTTGCNNSTTDFADFAKVKQTASLTSLGGRFLGSTGALKVLVNAYDKIVAKTANYAGLVTYNPTTQKLGLGSFVTSLVPSLADKTFDKAAADMIRNIINTVLTDYANNAATDIAAIVKEQINGSDNAANIKTYLASTTGVQYKDTSNVTDTTSDKSYYGIDVAANGTADDITKNVPKANLKTLFSSSASPLVKAAFDFRKYFPATLSADDSDGTRGNDFVNDDGLAWDMVKSTTDSTACTLSTAGACVKAYKVATSCANCEVTRAMKTSPKARIGTSAYSTDSGDFEVTALTAANGLHSGAGMPAGYSAGSAANGVNDSNYIYLFGGFTSPDYAEDNTTDVVTLYSVLDWTAASAGETQQTWVGVNGKVNAVVTIIGAIFNVL